MYIAKRTYLPEVVIYRKKEYTLDHELNNQYRDGKLITGKNLIMIHVLSKNLKGKLNLHNKSYQPTKWIFSLKKN